MRLTARLIASVWLFCGCDLAAQVTDSALLARLEHTIVRDLGWKTPEPAAQLRLQVLAPGLRLPGEARLHVAAVHPAGGANTWLLRMECSTRVECLPFEVVLQTHRSENSSIGTASAHSLPDSGNPLQAPMVRAGQRVQLAEQIPGMRLSAPAICLQAGSIGQRIRVRNASSGRVVLARVRAAGKVAVED